MSTLTGSLAVRDRRTRPRLAGLPRAATMLGFVALLSIAVGAKGIPLGDVVAARLGDDGSESAAIVTAIAILALSDPGIYVWFAFAGAAVASVVVYSLGSHGRASATPVRLALRGRRSPLRSPPSPTA